MDTEYLSAKQTSMHLAGVIIFFNVSIVLSPPHIILASDLDEICSVR